MSNFARPLVDALEKGSLLRSPELTVYADNASKMVSEAVTEAIAGLRSSGKVRSADPAFVGIVHARHIDSPSLIMPGETPGRISERSLLQGLTGDTPRQAYIESYSPIRAAHTQIPRLATEDRFLRSFGESRDPERLAQVSKIQSISLDRGSMGWHSSLGRSSWVDQREHYTGVGNINWERLSIKVGADGHEHTDVLKLRRAGEQVPASAIDTVFDPQKVRDFAQLTLDNAGNRAGAGLVRLDANTFVYGSLPRSLPDGQRETVGIIQSTNPNTPLSLEAVTQLVKRTVKVENRNQVVI